MVKLIMVFLLLASATSCSKSSSTTTNTMGTTGTTSTSNEVSIVNMSFSASTTKISAGITVTWTNNDNVAHTVTADDNSFTSGNLNKGDQFSHTFGTAGTVPYHCKIHPDMTATVIVN